jgi:cytochrome c oxidase subunit 2
MRHLRNPFVQVALWTLAITAVGTVVVLTVPWLPQEGSTAAPTMDTLYDVLAVVSVFFFALVISVLLVAIVHFRKRSPDDLRDGDPIHGNTRLEVIWTTIPALLMVGTAIYSGLVLADIEEPKANTHNVVVTGEQFAWTFTYEGEGFRAGELHLVKDTPYYFKIRAKDVLHSFWVPEFRMKKDAVPGMTTNVRVTPNRTGTYSVVCVELCGLGHSTMRATVKVEDQAAFDRWAERQKKGEGPQPGGLAREQGEATAR